MIPFRIRGPKRRDSARREVISIKYQVTNSITAPTIVTASVNYAQMQDVLRKENTDNFQLFHDGMWHDLNYMAHTLHDEFELLIGNCYTGREREDGRETDLS